MKTADHQFLQMKLMHLSHRMNLLSLEIDEICDQVARLPIDMEDQAETRASRRWLKLLEDFGEDDLGVGGIGDYVLTLSELLENAARNLPTCFSD